MSNGRFLYSLTLASTTALADGKFYVARQVPEVPFQRAAIWHDGAYQTMVVQSRYRIDSAQAASDFGWVIPVPGLPELGTMDQATANYLFAHLHVATQPEVTLLWSYLLVAVAGLLFVRTAAAVVAALRSSRPRHPWLTGSIRGNFGLFLVLGLFALFFGISPKGEMKTAVPPASKSVEVVKQSAAGSYELKVLRSSDASDLVAWLNAHNYRFDQQDERVFAEYIDRGWHFVTARLADTKPRASALVDPLVLGFPTKQPVYPLALTATANQSTEILLFVLSSSRTDAQSRLPLVYAGVNADSLPWVAGQVEAERAFAAERFAARYVTRFEGRMTAAEMRADLVLTKAADTSPYRPHVYTWNPVVYDRSRVKALGPPHLDPPLYRAIRTKDPASVEALLKPGWEEGRSGVGQPPMHFAAAHGGPAVLDLLIARGGNVNQPSASGFPLDAAASYGHMDSVRKLLDHGAMSASPNGISALYSAIMWSKFEIAELLIERGANVNHGELAAAATRDSPALVRLLLSKGADVNAVHGGRSPLCMAAQANKLDMVKLLVENGADVNQKSGCLRGSALAEADRSASIIEYLLSKGAR